MSLFVSIKEFFCAECLSRENLISHFIVLNRPALSEGSYLSFLSSTSYALIFDLRPSDILPSLLFRSHSIR